MRFLACLFLALSVVHAGWDLALPGWKYEFPRDHGDHPSFKTEWWYFTGNLHAADGREYGYQLTFFRQGVLDGRGDIIPLSRFVTRDVKFAHFALSDLSSGRFFFSQKLSRGAFGEAGFGKPPRLAWIDPWSCELLPDGSIALRASDGKNSLSLTLRSRKAPVIHGVNGVSQKAEGAGRASHYYSLTRLETSGRIECDGISADVTGLSWFDHEWATNQLAATQSGWDWFSLQFEDGSELMLFQLRLHAGGRDPYSGGTFVTAGGAGISLSSGDFTLTPGRTWRSTSSGASYPVEWLLEIKKIGLSVRVRAALDSQELTLSPVSYWEGSVRAEGTRDTVPVKARGYLEMTGYAGAVSGLQER